MITCLNFTDWNSYIGLPRNVNSTYKMKFTRGNERKMRKNNFQYEFLMRI